MLTPDEFLMFCDRALDGMVAIVEELGDELASARPELRAANSPYAILTHCLGVIDAWVGHHVAGRPLEWDREADFRATGPVDVLVGRVAEVRARLHQDVRAAEPSAALRHESGHAHEHGVRTQGTALQHVFQELAQHHGQMEITRDLLVGERAKG